MQNTLNKNNILLKNGFIELNSKFISSERASREAVATVLCNMIHFGYVPSQELYKEVLLLTEDTLVSFWLKYESLFKELTFEDRNMESFMVYKNFPEEVMNMKDSEYWIKQILIYMGMPVDYLREEKKVRPELTDKKDLKVLSLAKENTLDVIFENLMKKKSRWTDAQAEESVAIFNLLNIKSVDIECYGFKENAISMAVIAFENKLELKIKDSTDVLRLAALLSDCDVSLRTNVQFKNFKRSERKRLLSILDSCKNLTEDFGLRKEVWKKFMHNLHSRDYNFKNVNDSVDLLYNKKIKTFNSIVESKLINKDNNVLNLLVNRKGDFIRRFHKLYEVFGKESIVALKKVVSDLDTLQILKFKKYVLTINDRKLLIYAPKGNWSNALIVKNENNLEKNNLDKLNILNLSKVENLKEKFGGYIGSAVIKDQMTTYKLKIDSNHLTEIVKILDKELKLRLKNLLPNGVKLDEKLKNVKLPNNDQSLDVTYGRGTVFDIPEETNFIRTASYWKVGYADTVWYDNSWNFFNEAWKSEGSICWNEKHSGAIFSGDPISGKEGEGRACQVIDLDLVKLKEMGVRYAVWNILCYSGSSFNAVEEVLGTLQFAEDSLKGGVFEPSRMQMGFPLKGDNLTKYVALVDIFERKLIYMDANFKGSVRSASDNEMRLEMTMPAFMEYINTLPSVYDLFENALKGKGELKAMYSDKDVKVKEDVAYVFKRSNENNNFDNLDLSSLLK